MKPGLLPEVTGRWAQPFSDRSEQRGCLEIKMVNPGAFWDGIAERYAAQPIKDMAAYEGTLERTRAHLGPDAHVLELGCGTGTTALKLAGEVAFITATDVSAKMIAIAEEKACAAGITNVRFVRSDIDGCTTAVPGPHEGAYDAVLAFNLLHLVRDVPGALSTIAGLTKPGGVFVSKSACLKGAGFLYPIMIPVMQAFGKAPHVTYFTRQGLEEMITQAGFAVLETADLPQGPPPARFAVARRQV